MLKKQCALIVFLLYFGQSLFSQPLFKLLSPEQTGITFSNNLNFTENFTPFNPRYPYLGYIGGGAVIADLDKDSLPDLFFFSNQSGCRVYKNTGNLKFKLVNTLLQQSDNENGFISAVSIGDVNGDNLNDIFFSRMSYPDSSFAGNLLFLNEGKMIFSNQTVSSGLSFAGNSFDGSFFDFDTDGDLDFYLTNWPLTGYSDNIYDVDNNAKNYKYSDIFYENDGKGKFKNITRESGIIQENAYGLSSVSADFNEDGLTDIYVGNDFVHPDFLYINNGNATFTEQAKDFFEHTSLFTMGSDYDDLNNDGLYDLVTLDMNPERINSAKVASFEVPIERYQSISKYVFKQEIRNMLQFKTPTGFSEIGQMAGIAFTDWSWACLIEDFDNDCSKDIYISNGLMFDFLDKDYMMWGVDSLSKEYSVNGRSLTNLEKLKFMPKRRVKNKLYFGNPNGLKFSEHNSSGADVNFITNSASSGDLDNDGDIDIVISQIDSLFLILENKSNEISVNNFYTIRINEAKYTYNLSATLYSGLQKFSTLTYHGGGFAGTKYPELNFGLGKINVIDSIEIKHPSLGITTIYPSKVNEIKIINSNQFKPEIKKVPQRNQTIFENITLEGLEFRHMENTFNDVKIEPLLPYRNNAWGPSGVIDDINGDGTDDVLISGSSGYPLKVFIQDEKGNFTTSGQSILENDSMYEDAGLCLFDLDNDGDLDLYAVSGGNENYSTDTLYQDRLYINDGKGFFTKGKKEKLEKSIHSGSVVTSADFDRDGFTDLFVGRRTMPGSYPLPGKSCILKNVKGSLRDVTHQICPALENCGIITCAVWADIDNNGFVDLVVAGHWMPVLVFRNYKGIFSSPDTLAPSGLWNTLFAENLNEDDNVDIVAGNWGKNSRYVPNKNYGIKLYAKDFDKNGSIDPILCWTDSNNKSYPVYSFEKMMRNIPKLRKKFNRYRLYKSATIEDCFGEDIKDAYIREFKECRSMALINSGEMNNYSFVQKPFNDEAQVAPVFGIAAGNYDNSKGIDIVLHGNFRGNIPEDGSYDANYGLLLSGNNDGTFITIPQQVSGIGFNSDVRAILNLNKKNSAEQFLLFISNNDNLRILKNHSVE